MATPEQRYIEWGSADVEDATLTVGLTGRQSRTPRRRRATMRKPRPTAKSPPRSEHSRMTKRAGAATLHDTRRFDNGQRSRAQREERQTVRRPAQEGHEQGTRSEDRQQRRLLQTRRRKLRLRHETQSQLPRRHKSTEGRRRAQGRQKEQKLALDTARSATGSRAATGTRRGRVRRERGRVPRS